MKNEIMIWSEYLWPGRFHERLHISTRQYARIVRDWVTSIGLEASSYGTHSMRRTKVTQIYKKTGNPAQKWPVEMGLDRLMAAFSLASSPVTDVKASDPRPSSAISASKSGERAKSGYRTRSCATDWKKGSSEARQRSASEALAAASAILSMSAFESSRPMTSRHFFDRCNVPSLI